MAGGAVYADLRTMALSADPTAIGLSPSEALPTVWGVVMDLAYPEGTATVVGLSDGTTSLYTSSGGGVIGAGEHEAVAAATLRWLRIAEESLPALRPSEDFLLPEPGEVAFAVLTYSGGHRGTATMKEFEREGTDLTALFFAGQDVITELRRVEEDGG